MRALEDLSAVLARICAELDEIGDNFVAPEPCTIDHHSTRKEIGVATPSIKRLCTLTMKYTARAETVHAQLSACLDEMGRPTPGQEAKAQELLASFKALTREGGLISQMLGAEVAAVYPEALNVSGFCIDHTWTIREVVSRPGLVLAVRVAAEPEGRGAPH